MQFFLDFWDKIGDWNRGNRLLLSSSTTREYIVARLEKRGQRECSRLDGAWEELQKRP